MKRKGHLAVFENILENLNSGKKEDDDSKDSSEDEEYVQPKARKKHKYLHKEHREIPCRYWGCTQSFTEYEPFNYHLVEHVKNEGKFNESNCEYGDCDFNLPNLTFAIQHMVYHAYYDNLKNLGEITTRRDSLPPCKMQCNPFEFPTEVENYVCLWKYCGVHVDNYFDFLLHIKMHVNGNPARVGDKRIKCDWQGCGRGFNLMTQLFTHMAVHTKWKFIACPTCGGTFCNLMRFTNHRLRQLPKEKLNYKCSKCSKSFATESLLRDHVRSHINQYKCPMCDMTCPKPSSLASHMRFRHLKERMFKCNLCEHASISKQNLESHLMTHCSEKLFACAECDFQCRSMHGLDKHIQKEHGQNFGQIFECHICKKQCNRGGVLTKHLMRTHGVKWPSGHSRFRYKKDPDGIHRLLTIRYETVDVIKEILLDKTKEQTTEDLDKKLKCRFVQRTDENGTVVLDSIIDEVTESENRDVLLTISELDEHGNLVRQTVESQQIKHKKITIVSGNDF